MTLDGDTSIFPFPTEKVDASCPVCGTRGYIISLGQAFPCLTCHGAGAIPAYRVIYSDGEAGAPKGWRDTLRIIRQRFQPDDSFRSRGIVPVKVERA